MVIPIFIKIQTQSYSTWDKINISFKLLLLFSVTSFDSTYKYLKDGKGLLAATAPFGLFLQTNYVKDDDDWPDVQFHYLPHLINIKGARLKEKLNFEDKFWNSYFGPITGKHGYTVLFTLLRPKSRFANYFYITNAMISLLFFFVCSHSELSYKLCTRPYDYKHE